MHRINMGLAYHLYRIYWSGGEVLPSTGYVRNRPQTPPAAQHQRGYCFSRRAPDSAHAPRRGGTPHAAPLGSLLPSRLAAAPKARECPCVRSLKIRSPRGSPFAGKLSFHETMFIKMVGFHQNGFPTKRVTFRADVPFGVPSLKVQSVQK